MLINQKNKKQLCGFSLPEVLLAVFVLSIGVTTIVAVMTGSLRTSLSNNDVIVATGLAQEGVELVRNVRDNDFLVVGHNGFAAFYNNRHHCRVDWNDVIDTNDPNARLRCYVLRGSVATVRYDMTTTGTLPLYTHAGNGSAQGKYARYIYIDYDNTPGDEHALVRSFVFWGSFDINDIPANGDSSTCHVQANATGSVTGGCVFTETLLTSWK
ncbi:MAG: hypothetical protein KBA91_00195 [Candidatus Moranbacteria bacterium]|nr:hypothetical protein [Candidatus Moranbacteria bacterium]